MPNAVAHRTLEGALEMHTGGCSCGRVRYEIDAELEEVSFCYCGTCRRAQGGAFVAAAPIRAEHFRLVRGEDALKSFSSSPGKFRVFCGECGSPLFSRRDDGPGMLRIRPGTLDEDFVPRRRYRIFCEERVSWSVDIDSTPGHPRFEPGR